MSISTRVVWLEWKWSPPVVKALCLDGLTLPSTCRSQRGMSEHRSRIPQFSLTTAEKTQRGINTHRHMHHVNGDSTFTARPSTVAQAVGDNAEIVCGINCRMGCLPECVVSFHLVKKLREKKKKTLPVTLKRISISIDKDEVWGNSCILSAAIQHKNHCKPKMSEVCNYLRMHEDW